MRVEFQLVDVFAERPFQGNRLLVVPEAPAGLDAGTMAAIALEINFAESTFVTATRADGYDVRIFTPDAEIPFAGHPTLGTAFVLARLGMTGTDVVQVSGAGEIPVEVDLDGSRAAMRQLPPVLGAEVIDRDAVAAAAGLTVADLVDELPIVPATTGLRHVMVPVRDEAALRRASRHDSITEVCVGAEDSESLYLFTVRRDGDVMARMFDRGVAMEDSATGSAAGPLGAYLSEHRLAGMPGSLVVAQGELTGRPSILFVEVARSGSTWAITVAGGVQPMGDGAFEL